MPPGKMGIVKRATYSVVPSVFFVELICKEKLVMNIGSWRVVFVYWLPLLASKQAAVGKLLCIRRNCVHGLRQRCGALILSE